MKKIILVIMAFVAIATFIRMNRGTDTVAYTPRSEVVIPTTLTKQKKLAPEVITLELSDIKLNFNPTTKSVRS